VIDHPTLVALAREPRAAGRPRKLHATGHAMWPGVRDGDVVEVMPQTSPPTLGDIVLVVLKERLVLHRVVAVTPDTFTTKGDAVAHADPPLRPDDLLGTVRRGASVCGPWAALVSLRGGAPLAFALQRLRVVVQRLRV
jgi:hypothetical protein